MSRLTASETPRIAVTGMWSDQVHGLRSEAIAAAAAVLDAIVRAGGEPLVLPVHSPLSPAERLAGLDGLVVPGGYDLDPVAYGQQRLPGTTTADHAEQDAYETELIRAALGLGLPVLAICRGMQLVNVLYCGDLQQEISESHPGHLDAEHEVALTPGSRIARIERAVSITVSSYHHQAVGRVGAGLRVTGRSPDGVVEALEHESSPLVAVQWHPEDTAASDRGAQALFGWVVAEAMGRRRGRRAA
ncbi:MAG: Gamma-glutamyl-gamma-aminobutyrate hydrolase family protein [Pseudoclavibacter caeni]|jgi:putative glutamine amidotransferase